MNRFLFFVFGGILVFVLNLKSQPQWVSAGNVGQPGATPSISICNGNIAWIAGGTTTPKIFRTTNGGLNWTAISATGISYELSCMAGIDAQTAFVGESVVNGEAKLFKTTNGGANWNALIQTNINGGFFNGLFFTKQNGGLYGIAIAERIYKTTNCGITWMELNPGVNGVSCGQNSLMIIDDNFYGFGLNNGTPRIRLTTNNSADWSTYSINLSGNYTSTVAFNTNKLLGLSATLTSLPFIARTTDGGVTWSNINVDTGVTGRCFINWIPGTPVVYIMGENGGIKRSTNDGLNWVSMNSAGITNLKHFDFYKIGNIVYGYAVSSDGDVVKVVDTLNMITGINSNNSIPDEYSLSQNYPNPFNPTTQIEYAISKETFVKLIVYDILGREIKVLINENTKPGTYNVSFDGSELNSGVYFYKLLAAGFTKTKKMILIK